MLDVGAVSAGLAALLLCACSLQLAFGAGPCLGRGISLELRHLGNEQLFHVGTVVQHHFPPTVCCSKELVACKEQEDTWFLSSLYLLAISAKS